MSKLPDKPSALIRVAMADLEKCEKSPLYDIHMGEWHSPAGELSDSCQVCLAGAVMAQSMGTDPATIAVPDEFIEEEDLKLLALDEFQRGDVKAGLDYMDLESSTNGYASICAYRDNPAQFKLDMAKLADLLEEAGL